MNTKRLTVVVILGLLFVLAVQLAVIPKVGIAAPQPAVTPVVFTGRTTVSGSGTTSVSVSSYDAGRTLVIKTVSVRASAGANWEIGVLALTGPASQVPFAITGLEEQVDHIVATNLMNIVVPGGSQPISFRVTKSGGTNTDTFEYPVSTSFPLETMPTFGQLARTAHWGESKEISNVYVTIEAPFEDKDAPSKAPGRKVVVAKVTQGGRHDQLQFTAFDEQGRRYSSTATSSLPPLTAGDSNVTGYLAFDLPIDATVVAIDWYLPAFDWVNEWIWQ